MSKIPLAGRRTFFLALAALLAPAAGAQSRSGALEPGDPQLEQGEYYDAYEVEAALGQTIEADMASDAFDTYLVLVTPSGGNEQNDDYEGSQRRSYLRTTASEAGTYRVIATSYAGEETGPYRLDLSVGGESSATPSRRSSASRGGATDGGLVGSWLHGSPSAIQYVDSYTGASAPTSGLGTFLELHADGTYRYGGLMQITTYSCTSVLYRDDEGTYTASGGELVLNRASGRSWGRVCGGQESSRELGPETERYTYELSDGGATLTRYSDGSYYDELRRN